jgi:hypothetical protein
LARTIFRNLRFQNGHLSAGELRPGCFSPNGRFFHFFATFFPLAVFSQQVGLLNRLAELRTA